MIILSKRLQIYAVIIIIIYYINIIISSNSIFISLYPHAVFTSPFLLLLLFLL